MSIPPGRCRTENSLPDQMFLVDGDTSFTPATQLLSQLCRDSAFFGQVIKATIKKKACSGT